MIIIIIVYSFLCYCFRLEHIAHYKAENQHTHTRTHARTHAHTHTESTGQLAEVRFQRIKMKDVSDRTVKSIDYLTADRTVESKNHHRDLPAV